MRDDVTADSTSLGRRVRRGTYQEQTVPTSIVAKRLIAEAQFEDAAELVRFYLDEARHIYGFMTDCARRAREYLTGRGVDEEELEAYGRKVGELLRMPDGTAFDPPERFAALSAKVESAARACESGNGTLAVAAIDEMVDDWRRVHDRVVDRLCGWIELVRSRFGEPEVGLMHRAIFKPAIFDVRYPDYDIRNRDWREAFEDLVYLACEAMRAHVGGPNRDGAMELREEPDKVVMTFAPCGSGGRTLQRDPIDGSPPRAEPPFLWPVLKDRHDFTWNKSNICSYCAHCCVVMEQAAMDEFGYPVRVVDPPTYEEGGTGDVTCQWTIYRDPLSVPDEIYRRVGRAKPVDGA